MNTEALQRISHRQLSRLVSPAEMLTLLGVSSPTLWRMRRRGELPEPIRISAGRVGWREDVVAAWLESREAANR